MSLRWGKRSRGNIEQLCSPLQRLLDAYADMAPSNMDLTIIDSYRDEDTQNQAYDSGKSSVRYPNSKHNSRPSQAFDFIPSPFNGRKDWSDGYRFARIAGGLFLAAHIKKIHIRWGGDWDQDGKSNDQSFMDLGHIELGTGR